jgi:hypothetical protein
LAQGIAVSGLRTELTEPSGPGSCSTELFNDLDGDLVCGQSVTTHGRILGVFKTLQSGRSAARGAAKRITAIFGLAFSVLMLLAAPAGAWYAASGSYYLYYMPGPPPGGYLSGCAIDSSNGVASPSQPYATAYDYANSWSSCLDESVQVTYASGGNLYNSGVYYALANQTAGAFGPNGTGLVAGDFAACNTSYYCLAWSTSPFG